MASVNHFFYRGADPIPRYRAGVDLRWNEKSQSTKNLLIKSKIRKNLVDSSEFILDVLPY